MRKHWLITLMIVAGFVAAYTSGYSVGRHEHATYVRIANELEPTVVEDGSWPTTTTTAVAPTPATTPTTVAVRQAAPTVPVSVVASGNPDEQVWYRNPDGYCGSTGRATLGSRTPDPTCPDNKPPTYRDPSTEGKPVYYRDAYGYCTGTDEHTAKENGIQPDPSCEQGGYGSTPHDKG